MSCIHETVARERIQFTRILHDSPEAAFGGHLSSSPSIFLYDARNRPAVIDCILRLEIAINVLWQRKRRRRQKRQTSVKLSVSSMTERSREPPVRQSEHEKRHPKFRGKACHGTERRCTWLSEGERSTLPSKPDTRT